MAYEFRPPTLREGPVGNDRLSQFYTLDKGITLVKTTAGYDEYRFPTADIIRDNADFGTVYLGGRVYVVSDTEAAALTAAGYGSRLKEIV
jgi:hypothetical protein